MNSVTPTPSLSLTPTLSTPVVVVRPRLVCPESLGRKQDSRYPSKIRSPLYYLGPDVFRLVQEGTLE